MMADARTGRIPLAADRALSVQRDVPRRLRRARARHGRCGSRTTSRCGARARRAPPPTRSAGSELRLTIPPGQGLWCAGDHEPPLRVSGIQSGVWSGPAGGTAGSSRTARAGGCASPSRPSGAGRRTTAAGGARADGAQPAVDGRGVDGRAGGRAGALRRDLRLRGVRRRGDRRGRRGRRWASTRSATRRSRTTSTRRGCRSTSPSPTCTPRSGGPGGWSSWSTASTSAPGPGAGLPHADDGRGVRLPGARSAGAFADHVPELAVDLVAVR